MQFENIIFDLDGTLIDSAEDIIDSIKSAYYYALSRTDINIDKSLIGPQIMEIVKKITPELTELQVDKIVKKFRECYDKSNFPKTKLYSGVVEVLNNFKQRGFKLFVVTNKPILPTEIIIKKFKINLFDDIVTSDIFNGWKLDKKEMIAYLIKKHNLYKQKTLMVGDSVLDIEAARYCGISSMAVFYGYGEKSTLIKSNPTFIGNSILDLYQIL